MTELYINYEGMIDTRSNIPYNYSVDERNEMLRRLLQSFRVQRSTVVVTEEYMELPPADDDDAESEATESEAPESHNCQVPLSGERLESEALEGRLESEATESEAPESHNCQVPLSEAPGGRLESEATESEAPESNNCQVPLSGGRLDEERLDDSDSESEAEAEAESELQVQCQEITGKPLADLLVTLGECSICLDPIDQLVNVSNTRCGHTFHTHCFLRAIQSGSGNCPNCRTLLVVKESDDEDDESEYYSDDDEDDEDDGDEESNDTISDIVTLEQTASKLQNLGYSVADILAFYVGTTIRSQTPEKYNMEFFIKMNGDLDGILDGSIPLSQRDTRSYAAALTGGSGTTSTSTSTRSEL